MDMYYITRGDCVISIKGQQEMQVVVEGDHFGEIALLYGCRRTATVISRSYTNLAVLTEKRSRELMCYYPQFMRILKDNILQYNDEKI